MKTNTVRARVRILDIIIYGLIGIALVIYIFPIFWTLLTALKDRVDVFAIPPKYIFDPTADNFKGVFIKEFSRLSTVSSEQPAKFTPTEFPFQLLNSIIVAALSTLFAVTFGTMAAYSASRFRISGKDDLLFFILSTRMLPPVTILVPVFLMFRVLGLVDTRTGLIILYTMFNLGFAVWMMKGFLDEIPLEFEEAAMVDGYTRLEAFARVVLPQATTGIAATAVFCLITAWNEFLFATVVTSFHARTAPPSIAGSLGSAGIGWGHIAAASIIFLLPVFVFTFLVRNHLLRGVTFGVIKKM